MKKAFLGMAFVVGLACVASAQENNAAQGRTNAAASFEGTSASEVTLLPANDAGNFLLGDANAAPEPAALPAAPTPKYVFFGDRDDYRWQLGVGFDYLRFQSKAFDSNLFGLNTTLTYYTNSWFAVEGNIVAGFGPTVFNSNDHAKIFGYMGGIRIGGRRARWEPYGHALVGGSHLQPQTALGGRNAIMAEAGVGVDYRVHSRLSLRGEGDWTYTGYFNGSQNNFQLVAGVVFHF